MLIIILTGRNTSNPFSITIEHYKLAQNFVIGFSFRFVPMSMHWFSLGFDSQSGLGFVILVMVVTPWLICS